MAPGHRLHSFLAHKVGNAHPTRLNAAFLAAEANGPIGMAPLQRAAHVDAAKRERRDTGVDMKAQERNKATLLGSTARLVPQELSRAQDLYAAETLHDK